jgi:hypothetical protein
MDLHLIGSLPLLKPPNYLILTLLGLTSLGWGGATAQASPEPGEETVEKLAIEPALGETSVAIATSPFPAPSAPQGSTTATVVLAPVGPISDPALETGQYLTTAAALAAPLATDRPSEPALPPSNPAPLLGQGLDEDEGLDDDESLAQDPELGLVQVRGLSEDTDLGILRIRAQPTLPDLMTEATPNIGFLTARLAIASSDNVLLAVNDIGGLTGDTFLRPSLGVGFYPFLGSQTVFIATADLGLQRYISQSPLNYDDLRFRVGVRQVLTPRSYAQLLLTYQELFRPGGNRSRFFKNTALGLTLGRRDPLAPQLTLDSYYLIQFNGAQATSQTTIGPISTDFSRIFQSGGAYLGYDITPQLQAGVSYQLNLFDYTVQDRFDTLHQVLGQVAYRFTPTVRMSLYGGVSFGRSSEPRVRFNDTFVGAVIDANLPLF